jgi:hypothetical protein
MGWLQRVWCDQHKPATYLPRCFWGQLATGTNSAKISKNAGIVEQMTDIGEGILLPGFATTVIESRVRPRGVFCHAMTSWWCSKRGNSSSEGVRMGMGALRTLGTRKNRHSIVWPQLMAQYSIVRALSIAPRLVGDLVRDVDGEWPVRCKGGTNR